MLRRWWISYSAQFHAGTKFRLVVPLAQWNFTPDVMRIHTKHTLKLLIISLNHFSPLFQRSKSSQRLISHDVHSNTYNYKSTFSVEIVPICKVIPSLPQPYLGNEKGGASQCEPGFHHVMAKILALTSILNVTWTLMLVICSCVSYYSDLFSSWIQRIKFT